MPLPHPVIAIVGATATGKSDLGLEVADHFDGEIINADSMQLYRGMDIGTAKVPAQDRRGIRHYQLDVLDVTQEASVAAYQRYARADLEQIASARPVVVVGGSGLYVRALLDDFQFPPTDPQVRSRLEREAETVGTTTLYKQLAQQDPLAAGNIEPRNTRRIVRALEVIELTGKPFSATMPRHEYFYQATTFAISTDRELLKERIAARAESMFKSGLIEETEHLISQGLLQAKTAAKATGYAQALGVIQGHLALAEAIEATAVATHQLARRQLTWFGKDPRITWLNPDEPMADQVIAKLAAQGSP